MANQAAAKGEEGFMQLGPFFISDAQAAELMQPREGTLDDPAQRAQTRAVRQTTPRQPALDAALGQGLPVWLRIIRTIPQYPLGTAARRAAQPCDRGNRLHEGQQLRDIVGVGAGEDGRQRYAAGVGDYVVLGASLATVRRIRSCFFPPWTARTDDESTTARDRSSCSRRRNSASSVACKRAQTPAACQSRKRRQHVMPEQPNSAGSISQGMPLLSTNKMPVKASRSSTGLRPGYLKRRAGFTGSSGATKIHKSSSSSGLAIALSQKHRECRAR